MTDSLKRMQFLVTAVVALSLVVGACAETIEDVPTQSGSSGSGGSGVSNGRDYDLTPLPNPVVEAQICAILDQQREDHYRETVKILEEVYSEQGLTVNADTRAEARRQIDAVYDTLDRDNDC